MKGGGGGEGYAFDIRLVAAMVRFAGRGNGVGGVEAGWRSRDDRANFTQEAKVET